MARDHGMERYRARLDEKISFLEYLIRHCNDGRRKNFYCIAVNLLEPGDLDDIKKRMETWDQTLAKQDRIRLLEAWFREKAESRQLDLKLRK